MSDGTVLAGEISTTPTRPLRVWDVKTSEYRDVPIELVRSIKAEVLWERDEAEWQFKESGSDVKVYSGKSYPARETQYVFTLVNGQSFTGGVVAPLYVKPPDAESRTQVVLHKRDKGDVGQPLKGLVYPEAISFDP